jgi:FkbM family methyltransferase
MAAYPSTTGSISNSRVCNNIDIQSMAPKEEKRPLSAMVYARLVHRWAIHEPELKLLPELCARNSLAIDVGAYKGLYTWFLLQRTNNVIAFEPLPPMQTLLQRQYGNKIVIRPIALSDRSGRCQLTVPDANYGLATVSDANKLGAKASSLTQIMVRAATLDSFDFRDVGFVKIDVEGHEEAVLRGARATLMRDMPNLVIEIEERHAPGATLRVPELLKNIGYAGFYIDMPRIAALRDFTSDRDQPPSNVNDGNKTGRYINNFIFVRNDRAEETRHRLQRLIDEAASGNFAAPG